jgi:NIPSNAP protein
VLIELRTDTIHPGKLADFLKIVEPEILPLERKYAGKLIGYFTTETGDLNQVVQLWAYRDAADFDERRAALWNDATLAGLRERVRPIIQRQESRLLKPASFSPLPWDSPNDDAARK